MTRDAPSIDWVGAFGAVCGRSLGALEWALPEPWIHAELYAELKRRSRQTGWVPISHEVPYVTHYPVQLPAKTNRDWKSKGAIKWVDLCLHHRDSNSWCWFEFKVRHAGTDDRSLKASASALDAFRKDVVALIGFDVRSTADTWARPDVHTKTHWAERLLKPHEKALLNGQQHFLAALLYLNGELDSGSWSQSAVRSALESWLAGRRNRSCQKRDLPEMQITQAPAPLSGHHALMIFQWRTQAAQLRQGLR